MASLGKVLVVDDEISLVQLCELVLQSAGFSVCGALSGRQALRLIDEQDPDLVLLDVMMPGMDGIEVCRQIRTNKRPRKIIMYTADLRDSTRQNSLAAGADDFITKDIPIYDLPSRLSHFLAQ
jgi:DNA-binding response OmpR family regulator